jgi:hypothetical protein
MYVPSAVFVPAAFRYYTQGYYRRGDANFMLGKFKEALKDLKTVRAGQAGRAYDSTAQHGSVQGIA